MQFTTNSLGFRGPEPDSFPNHPILFLGDSFTAGYGVNDDEESPALIRKALAKRYGAHRIPVVNTGLGDSGNGYWIKFLKKEGKRYDPRLVVLELCETDFEDNIREHLFGLSSLGELEELPVPPPGEGENCTTSGRVCTRPFLLLPCGVEQTSLVAANGQSGYSRLP